MNQLYENLNQLYENFHSIINSIVNILKRQDKMISGLAVIDGLIIFTLIFLILTVVFLHKKLIEVLKIIDESVTITENCLEEHEKAINALRCTHIAEIPSEDTYSEQRIQEVIQAKEKFQELSKTLSLEEFKKEVKEYFDEKIEETYEVIDNAWGDELLIACEMQKRYQTRWERAKNALTNEETLAAMFSPC